MAAEKERLHWPSSHNSITPGLGGVGAALLGAGGEALWLSVGGWNSFAYVKIHIECI